MSSPVTSARSAPSAPVPLRRHRRIAGATATGSDRLDDGRIGRLELVLTVTTIVAMSAVARGEAIWLVAGLVLAGAVAGSPPIPRSLHGPDAGPGGPLEAL